MNENQGKTPKQVEDSYWMLEKAMQCFVAAIIFFIIFKLAS